MPMTLLNNRHSLDAFQSECTAALHAVAEKHGVSIQNWGGTMGEIEAVLKFKVRITDKTIVGDKEKADFETYCRLYDLTPEHYLTRFPHKGETYEIYGFDLGRPKFCVKARNVKTGKAILFAQAAVA